MMVLPSCSPRCATGRATSQSIRDDALSYDFENPIDFHRGIARQHGDADRRARMTPPVLEYCNHEVGRAIHDFGTFEKTRIGIDEPAETNDTRHLVEIAECRLELRQNVDGARACRFLAVVQ